MKDLACLFILLSIFSCSQRLQQQDVHRENYCTYFTVTGDSVVRNGQKGLSINTRINKRENDPVSTFIQDHSFRFEYLVSKYFTNFLQSKPAWNIDTLNSGLCRILKSDSFNRNFLLLTNARPKDAPEIVSYSAEMAVKIAARFYECDHIDAETGTIGTHICVVINGVSRLPVSGDHTPLEALMFEAIFRSRKNYPLLSDLFSKHVDEAMRLHRFSKKDPQGYLEKVRGDCYRAMEREPLLLKTILDYYRGHRNSVGFVIE